MRAIYSPLAEYLVTQPDGVANKEALEKVKSATEAYWVQLWKQPEIAAEVLDSRQIDTFSLRKD
ncbi:hypothetical protein [Gemmatimonas groenlandica]|uniref:Uncharacterized protein n=1 Tax=Gemmatimonas groenlandica TaxID=2732249 RepID=A0A6M4IZ31_9BACT|nr:hypothetical protein [Gemmatimonas groenlandica]QJR37491.1 hypothetical protein HKW67_19220 [Gemmatimonas groenlandica]